MNQRHRRNVRRGGRAVPACGCVILREGALEDGAEAVRRFLLSEEQGFAAAQYHRGPSYPGFKGVGQDDVEADTWLDLSAAEGSKERLPERRNEVVAGMIPRQISDAQRLARNWDVTHALVARVEPPHFKIPGRLHSAANA